MKGIPLLLACTFVVGSFFIPGSTYADNTHVVEQRLTDYSSSTISMSNTARYAGQSFTMPYTATIYSWVTPFSNSSIISGGSNIKSCGTEVALSDGTFRCTPSTPITLTSGSTYVFQKGANGSYVNLVGTRYNFYAGGDSGRMQNLSQSSLDVTELQAGNFFDYAFALCSDYECALDPLAFSFVNSGGLNLPFATGTIGIATSSSLWGGLSSTSIQSLTVQCDYGYNFLASGLCQAIAYLFTPNPNVFTNYNNVVASGADKFPFSWYYSLRSGLASLNASSTNNMVDLKYNFANLGIGSTTAMGNIMPNITVFSTSTVTNYVGASNWALFYSMMVAVEWLAFAYYLYRRVNHWHLAHK